VGLLINQSHHVTFAVRPPVNLVQLLTLGGYEQWQHQQQQQQQRRRQ